MQTITMRAAVAKRGADYSAADVQILGPIEGMRKRPSQYLGDNSSGAVTHMIFEPVDNGIDEFNADRNDYVSISVQGNVVTVVDHGGGIPVEKHAKTGKSVFEEVFMNVHAGGKFGSDAYGKGSIGTHGIGMTVVNALSAQLQVWTIRKNQCYAIIMQKGKMVRGIHKAACPIKGMTRGTVVRFTPDFSCFEKGAAFDVEKLKARLSLSGYLNSGCRILLNVNGETTDYTQTGGIVALLEKEIVQAEAEAIIRAPVVVDSNGIHMALTWVNSGDEWVTSYVNSAHTRDGGVHVAGLNSALLDALKPYKGTRVYSASDLRSGMFCIVNVNVKEPLFTSQTKEELRGSQLSDVKADVYAALKPALDEFFAKNKSIAAEIVKRAEATAKLNERFIADKKALKDISSKSGVAGTLSKLAAARTKDKEKIELFLVEGDSAGGTAKEARDREFQSVLPLRGKMLNSFKSKTFMMNSVVQDVLRCVGGLDGEGREDPRTRRVGKVILLADPDVDGKHITLLLLSLFQRVLPSMFAEGRIYTVDSQLFNCFYKGQRYFGDSPAAVLDQLKGGKPKDGVQRIKGWGEVKKDVLGPAAFDVKTRKLIRVAPLRPDEMTQFVSLVGEGAGERRKLLGV